MSTRLEGVLGSDRDWPLQCWNEGGLTTPSFLADDALSAVVSPGEGQAALFSPAVAWWTAPDPVTGQPTQTGYDQAQVLLSVAGSDMATLTAEAGYAVEVWRQPAGSMRRYCVWSGTLVAHWAAGVGLPRVPTYCTYQDMLEFGPWAKYLQESSDEAAFYDQRLEARVWLDELITKSFRGSSLYPFGMPAVPYKYWSGWAAPWRSPMPSQWVRDQLWGGMVNAVPTITARGSGYVSPPTVTAPDPAPSLLPWIAHRQKPAVFVAVLDGAGGLGAVLTSDPGFGYIPGQVLTPAITGGGGTGAQVTATASTGTLIVRDQVRRLAAWKSLSILGLSQIGVNPQHVAYGEYFAQRCSEELTSFTAEMDQNQDGYPDLAIPCNFTNTIYM